MTSESFSSEERDRILNDPKAFVEFLVDIAERHADWRNPTVGETLGFHDETYYDSQDRPYARCLYLGGPNMDRRCLIGQAADELGIEGLDWESEGSAREWLAGFVPDLVAQVASLAQLIADSGDMWGEALPWGDILPELREVAEELTECSVGRRPKMAAK